MSYLSELGNTLDRLAEERRQKDEDRINLMEEKLPEEIANLPNRTIDDMLDLYHRANSYYIDNREQELWLKYADAIKAEFHRRIGEK